MTEKEMMKQMQNLLGIRKKPSEKETEAIALADSVDELAEMFCDSAIVLSRIASLLQGKKNPWDTKNFEDMDGWDEDDMACMDATVLFAVPGKPVQLMTEEDVLSKFPGFDDEQTFYCVEIGDHLFLHYMEHTWESEDDITMPQFDTRALMDYGQMKEKLTLQMIPIAGNEEKLSEIPHRPVEDMALVYRFEMESNEQGSASILVTNNMLQTYDITADQLHSDALEAAVQNNPATLRNMNEVLRDMMGDAAGIKG